MEMIRYYTYEIFKSRNLNKYLELENYKFKADPNVTLIKIFKFKENDTFEFKIPFNILSKDFLFGDEDEILGEYLVGMKLNELRDYVPNFVYTYMLSNENIIHSLNNLNEFYKTFDKSNYSIIMEYIEGIQFTEFLDGEKFDITDVINILLQVTLALNAVNQHFEFIHNDLTSDNIIIRRLKKEKIISYKVLLNGKLVKINLKTYFNVKIIDFGLSKISFNYNNKIYKYNPYNSRNTKSDDIYKLFEYAYYSPYGSSYIESIYEYIENNLYKSYDEILYYIIYESEFKKYLDFSDLMKSSNYNQCLIKNGGNPKITKNLNIKINDIYNIIKNHMKEYVYNEDITYIEFEDIFLENTKYITLRTNFKLSEIQQEDIHQILINIYDQKFSDILHEYIIKLVKEFSM